MRASFDTRELRTLILDLDNEPVSATKRLQRAVRDGAGALTQIWKQNARDTAGSHGKRYPRAISYDTYDGDLMAEIGPVSRMRQGGMSFEYGSRNQPPHLDGNRAADDVFRWFPKRVADAAELDL